MSLMEGHPQLAGLVYMMCQPVVGLVSLSKQITQSAGYITYEWMESVQQVHMHYKYYMAAAQVE